MAELGKTRMLSARLGEAKLIQGPKGDKGDKGDTGSQGEKGEAFTYADFTPEQLAGLTGPKGDKGDTGPQGETGPKGDKGDKGDAFTYQDFTPEQLEGLRGPKGDSGAGGGGDGESIGGVYPDMLQMKPTVLTGDNGSVEPARLADVQQIWPAEGRYFAIGGSSAENAVPFGVLPEMILIEMTDSEGSVMGGFEVRDPLLRALEALMSGEAFMGEKRLLYANASQILVERENGGQYELLSIQGFGDYTLEKVKQLYKDAGDPSSTQVDIPLTATVLARFTSPIDAITLSGTSWYFLQGAVLHHGLRPAETQSKSLGAPFQAPVMIPGVSGEAFLYENKPDGGTAPRCLRVDGQLNVVDMTGAVGYGERTDGGRTQPPVAIGERIYGMKNEVLGDGSPGQIEISAYRTDGTKEQTLSLPNELMTSGLVPLVSNTAVCSDGTALHLFARGLHFKLGEGDVWSAVEAFEEGAWKYAYVHGTNGLLLTNDKKILLRGSGEEELREASAGGLVSGAYIFCAFGGSLYGFPQRGGWRAELKDGDLKKMGGHTQFNGAWRIKAGPKAKWFWAFEDGNGLYLAGDAAGSAQGGLSLRVLAGTFDWSINSLAFTAEETWNMTGPEEFNNIPGEFRADMQNIMGYRYLHFEHVRERGRGFWLEDNGGQSFTLMQIQGETVRQVLGSSSGIYAITETGYRIYRKWPGEPEWQAWKDLTVPAREMLWSSSEDPENASGYALGHASLICADGIYGYDRETGTFQKKTKEDATGYDLHLLARREAPYEKITICYGEKNGADGMTQKLCYASPTGEKWSRVTAPQWANMDARPLGQFTNGMLALWNGYGVTLVKDGEAEENNGKLDYYETEIMRISGEVQNLNMRVEELQQMVQQLQANS